MKRILQKSYAWLVTVVMMAMSTSAMAETKNFDLTYTTPSTHTQDPITITFDGWTYNRLGPYGNGKGSTIRIACAAGYNITAVNIENGAYSAGYNFKSGHFSASPQGDSFNIYTSSCEWTGETQIVTFTQNTYDPTIISSISVTYTTASGGGGVTPSPDPSEFPLEGVAYQFRCTNSGSYYLNVLRDETQYNGAYRSKDVQLLNAPQALYFTKVTGGYTITTESGLFVGQHPGNTWNMNADNTETWTLEEVSGGYVLKCNSTSKYLGFNNYVAGVDGAAFRDKAKNAAGIFAIEEYAPASAKGESNGQYFGTYYNNISWIVPANCTAYTVSGVEDGSANLVSLANAGEVVAADVPVLLVANQQINGVAVKGSSNVGVSPASENLLVGTAADATVGGDGAKYYVLTLKDDNLAFCWDRDTNDEGASASLAAHKACLRVSGAGSNVLKFHFEDDTVTGIKTVATEKAAPIYNLQGQRVNATAAGIYVKNGKKFIVK